ncbi:hypothetical protein Tco_1323792, partial [Tanacetum coccineum]
MRGRLLLWERSLEFGLSGPDLVVLG